MTLGPEHASGWHGLIALGPLARSVRDAALFLSPVAPEDTKRNNWLPTPDGRPFSLTLRTYIPQPIVQRCDWFPAPATLTD